MSSLKAENGSLLSLYPQYLALIDEVKVISVPFSTHKFKFTVWMHELITPYWSSLCIQELLGIVYIYFSATENFEKLTLSSYQKKYRFNLNKI